MAILIITICLLSLVSFAQAPPPEATASCTFTDGKALTMRYLQAASNPKSKDDPPSGKVWAPGDAPMSLFLETPVILNRVEIPIGAVSVYLIGGKEWTLVVSRNVTAGSAYDPQQDVVRAPMEVEKLPQAEGHLGIYFGHVQPKVCEMRLDYGKTRASLQFAEK